MRVREASDERPAVPPRAKKRRRTRRRSGAADRRVHLSFGVLAVALVALILALPAVRTVLRQSFTHLPQPYTSVYFTDNPTIDGTHLKVPVTVQGVDTGTSTYSVHVWTVTAAGAVDGRTTAKISTANGVSSTVVTMTLVPDAAVVWVSLDGTQQTIHYRISKT